MSQTELRTKLIDIIDAGLSAKAISINSGISYDLLAKFKQGRLYLIEKDANKLNEYLSKVKIPTTLRSH